MPTDGKPLPCIICGFQPAPVFNGEYSPDDKEIQPAEAVMFTSKGNYGSKYFDPLDGSYLVLNICDSCVENSVDNGYIVKIDSKLLKA
jgi:hypothetical protein